MVAGWIEWNGGVIAVAMRISRLCVSLANCSDISILYKCVVCPCMRFENHTCKICAYVYSKRVRFAIKLI